MTDFSLTLDISELVEAPQSVPIEEPRLGLKWSFVGHFIFILMILFTDLVFPTHPLRYIPTLKVDLVALPDTLKKDLKNPNRTHFEHEIREILKEAENNAPSIKTTHSKESKSTAREVAKKDEMLLKPKHLSEKVIERKNLQALQRIKSLAKIQDNSDTTPSSAPEHELVKGNRISPGMSVSNEAKEASEASYYDILQDRLQDNWTLPPWVARQNLQAQVLIFIDSRGRLHGFKFMKLSGNPQFDDAVKRALQESQPFPFPPPQLASTLLSHGILVGFPL